MVFNIGHCTSITKTEQSQLLFVSLVIKKLTFIASWTKSTQAPIKELVIVLPTASMP